jgi:hypothetical protein
LNVLSLHWSEGRPGPAAIELLGQARLEDTEMSFVGRDPYGTPRRSFTLEVSSRLYRRGQAKPQDFQLGAVLTVDEWCEGIGSVNIVVAPPYRSMGLATATLEALGGDSLSAALADRTGLGEFVSCSFGTHPSAVRLARRFDAVVRGQRHWLLLPSRPGRSSLRVSANGTGLETTAVVAPRRPPQDSIWHAVVGDVASSASRVAVESADGTLAGEALVEAHGDEGPGSLAVVHELRLEDSCSPGERDRVIASVVEWLWSKEATAIEVVIDAADAETLLSLRRTGFRHDRTDTLYADGGEGGTGSDSVRALARPLRA